LNRRLLLTASFAGTTLATFADPARAARSRIAVARSGGLVMQSTPQPSLTADDARAIAKAWQPAGLEGTGLTDA
jgi:hypothetical protein